MLIDSVKSRSRTGCRAKLLSSALNCDFVAVTMSIFGAMPREY